MLTTLVRAKKFLQLPPSEEDQDIQVELLIGPASEAIERYCFRSFREGEHVELVSGTGSPYLTVKNPPIHEIIEISNLGGFITDYTILDDGLILRSGCWSYGHHNFKVIYRGGYTLPQDSSQDSPSTLPQTLEFACILLIQTWLRGSGVKSERIGDIAVTYADEEQDLPVSVKALINPYVRRWV